MDTKQTTYIKKSARVFMVFIAMIVLFTGSPVQAQLVIDDWTTGQLPLFVGTNDEFNPPPKTDGKLRDGNMLGGERDLVVEVENVPNYMEGIRVALDQGELYYRQDGSVRGKALLIWDGDDDNFEEVQSTGLDSVDFTGGGMYDAIHLTVLSNVNPIKIGLVVLSDKDNISEISTTIPGNLFNKAGFSFLFNDFVVSAGAGASFSHVGAIILLIGAGNNTGAFDIRFGPLMAIADTDGDGVPNSEDSDDDNDGMKDDFELENGYNPLIADENNNGIPDGEDDTDNDGLKNYEEQDLSSNPRKQDTDGDGVIDGRELELRLDPIRFDGSDFSVEKTGPLRVSPGETEITYEIKVKNRSNRAVGQVVIEELLPEGATVVSTTLPEALSERYNVVDLGRFEADEVKTYTLTIKITAADGDTIRNIVELGINDPDDDNDLASAYTYPVTDADLRIDKRAVRWVKRGKLLNYYITVYNQGPSDAYDVEITDMLPQGVTYKYDDVGSLVEDGTRVYKFSHIPANDSAMFSITVEVDSTAQNELLNKVLIRSARQYDSNVENNTDSTLTTVLDEYEVDLAVSKSAPQFAQNGDQIVYTITVENRGDTDAHLVRVWDVIPAGLTVLSSSVPYSQDNNTLTWTIDEIKSKQSVTITVTARVSASAGTDIENTVNVGSLELDSDYLNNRASTVTGVKGPWADLEVDITTSPATTRPTQSVFFRITVKNNGPSTATEVKVMFRNTNVFKPDRLLPNYSDDDGLLTIDLGTIPGGGARAFNLPATVSAGVNVSAQGRVINAEARASAKQPDYIQQNNEKAVEVTLTEPLSTKLSDPNTRFHRLAVIGHERFWFENRSRRSNLSELEEDLFKDSNQANTSTFRILTTPTKTQLQTAINGLKAAAQAGDEVTILFSGHGHYGIDDNGVVTDADGDEPRTPGREGDESFWLNKKEDLYDDELAYYLQGFNRDVTVLIVFDACFAAYFTDGSSDIKERDNLTVIGATGAVPVPLWGPLAETVIEALADGAGEGSADTNGDGIVTAEEVQTYIEDEIFDDYFVPGSSSGGSDENRLMFTLEADSAQKRYSGKSSCGSAASDEICGFLPFIRVHSTIDAQKSGYHFNISGGNFAGGSGMEVFLLGRQGDSLSLAQTTLDASGAFAVSFFLPDSQAWKYNDYMLVAEDEKRNNDWWPLETYINRSPRDFVRRTPADSAGQSARQLQFTWTTAYDAPWDSIAYRLQIKAGFLDTSLTTADTSLTVDLDALGIDATVKTVQWTVYAGDGKLEAIVNNGWGEFGLQLLSRIAEEEALIEEDGFALMQNYPNPFNPVTRIRFTLTRSERIELSVLNMRGRQVMKILERPFAAGVHVVEFDATDLASGVYFYRLRTEGGVQMRKMILQK
ncbi:DUF11 domain-containing protein [candidate division KSB1 bacterium]|nr:DUF11 domain-containing protein [candidate division KSB1 bacterium]